MSVSDSGSRVQPSSGGARPMGAGPVSPGGSPPGPLGGPPRGPSRQAQRRGRIVLGVTLVVFVAGAAWIVTHAGDKSQAGPGGAPGAQAAGGRGAGGRSGGARGGRGGFGGGLTAVGAAQAATGDVPVYLSALGTVTPAATVTVRTQLAGQLFSVAFREGQLVRKGQGLAQVDPRPYQAALGQAEGVLARDQALLANARLDQQRYQTLLSQDSIAKQQVDTQAALVRQDEGTVKTDQAAVATARLNLAYTRITAPVGGKVGLRQVDPGNYVANSDANGLVTITEISPIDVVFTIPEDQLAQVNKRMGAGARLEVTAYDRSGQTQLAEGALSTLDNQIDTTTGTLKAKARFGNGDGALYPNQFVNIRVLVDTLHGVVTAPTSAVLRGQDGLFVYVVDGTRTVHLRNVTTGPAAGDVTAVTAGLNAGETVVTDGSDRLREGAHVLLPGDCPPASGAGGPGGRGGAGSAPGAPSAAKLSWWDKLLGKKPPPAPAARPGFTADGQRCRPVNFAGAAGGQGGGTAQVIAQLNLDPGQAAKVKTITDAMRAQMGALRESGDFAAMRQARDNMNTQIEAVLRPDQVAKFKQLQAEQRARYAAGGGFGGGAGGGGMQPGAAPAAPAAPGVPSPSDRTYAAPPASAGAASVGPVPATPAMPPPAARGSRGGGLEPGGGRNPAAPRTDAPPAVPAGTAGGYGGGGQGGGGRGAALFANLGLSPEQQARIDAIRAEYGPKMRAAYEGGDMEAAGAVRREMGAKMEAVMTPAQRAKFEAARAAMRAQGGGGGGGGPPGGL